MNRAATPDPTLPLDHAKRPPIDQAEIVAYVLTHPGCTSDSVAEALDSTSKIVGAHLTKIAVRGDIVQYENKGGGNAKFVYGPVGWVPSKPSRPGRSSRAARAVAAAAAPSSEQVVTMMRTRLVHVLAELDHLSTEAAALRASLSAYEAIAGGSDADQRP